MAAYRGMQDKTTLEYLGWLPHSSSCIDQILMELLVNGDLTSNRTEANDDNMRYLDELMRELRQLNQLQLVAPTLARHAALLLNNEIGRIWSTVFKGSAATTTSDGSSSPRSVSSTEKAPFVLTEKILIPDKSESTSKCNMIGRILGPCGMSLQQLEADTDCTILIRGVGSVKDPQRESRLIGRCGWEHLSEPLHVLITATDDKSKARCEQKMENAVSVIKGLLVPQDDEYKKKQLIQLAIIKGTYRQNERNYE